MDANVTNVKIIAFDSMLIQTKKMKHKILFIGGAGFIGSSVIKELEKDKGYRDLVFVLEPSHAKVTRLEGTHARLIRGKISDIEIIESVIKANGIKKVVHLVSTMVPGSGYDEYKQEFENVIFPTVRLAQLCSRLGVQLVYFSSGGTVYGERKTLVPFVETDPKEPISYYGLSKQMIENSILFEHRVSNLDFVILRPSNPYGHGQSINGRQGLIAVALGKVLAGETMTIWGDGNQVRDYIYIDDLSKVVVQLLKEDLSCRTINIGSGKGYTVKEVLKIVSSVVDEDIAVEYTPSRRNDVSNMILDNSLLRSLCDVQYTPLKEGIKMFYEYERARLNISSL